MPKLIQNVLFFVNENEVLLLVNVCLGLFIDRGLNVWMKGLRFCRLDCSDKIVLGGFACLMGNPGSVLGNYRNIFISLPT